MFKDYHIYKNDFKHTHPKDIDMKLLMSYSKSCVYWEVISSDIDMKKLEELVVFYDYDGMAFTCIPQSLFDCKELFGYNIIRLDDWLFSPKDMDKMMQFCSKTQKLLDARERKDRKIQSDLMRNKIDSHIVYG